VEIMVQSGRAMGKVKIRAPIKQLMAGSSVTSGAAYPSG